MNAVAMERLDAITVAARICGRYMCSRAAAGALPRRWSVETMDLGVGGNPKDGVWKDGGDDI